MHAEVVVLGTGPTAIFAYELLRREHGSVRLAGSFADASVSPVPTPFGPVTLVPVFPPGDVPAYPPSAHTAARLRVSRVGDSEWIDEIARSEGSLLSTFPQNRDGAVMSFKQFGPRSAAEPLDEVQRKVARAYGAPSTGRVGYVDGVSAYFAPMAESLAAAVPPPVPLAAWMPADHVLDLGAELLTYDRLVYAASVDRLIDALGIDLAVPDRVPATFTLHAAAGEIEPDRLVYDLRRESPLFRVFTPRSRIALAQHSQADGLPDPVVAAEVLAGILGTAFDPIGAVVTVSNAYPVESLPPDDAARLDAVCGELGILRFGRNATARYVDLHELPWGDLLGWSR